MVGRIFTVGGLTLLSRLTGFFRDVVLAAVLGAGPVADAFFVALRLPNHFRAIFAEGAFNAAFVPAYARIRAQAGAEPAKLFADRVFTLLLATAVAELRGGLQAALALTAQDGQLVVGTLLRGLLQLGQHEAERADALLLSGLHGSDEIGLHALGNAHCNR